MLPSKECTGCMACVELCSIKCIKVVEDANGFFYPKIDEKTCVDCKKCEKICPVLSKSVCISTDEDYPEALAGYALDPEVRRLSSSGGIFTALSLQILEKNGVVVGVAFDKCFNVSHMIVKSKEELSKLRGSKYVQSDIRGCYENVKELVQRGVLVLFSGTPCQIEALRAILGKTYDNLILVDIICHGVPSNRVWQRYLNWQKVKHNADLVNVNFRDKCSGWDKFSLSLMFEDGTRYQGILDKDPYMKAFLQNLCLRESCYQCHFKTKRHNSDLTIGDLWGIDEIEPKLNDNAGTSVVFIQSSKGKKIIDILSKTTYLKTVDSKISIEKNGAMIHSVYRHPMRDYFLNKLDNMDFDKLVSRCLNPGIGTRLERKILQLIKQV